MEFDSHSFSPQQRHIWSHKEHGASLRSIMAINIKGAIDEQRLGKAIEGLPERFDVFQTADEATSLTIIQKAESEQGDLPQFLATLGDHSDKRDATVLTATLVHFGEAASSLLLLEGSAMHFDQVSMNLLFQAIISAYAGDLSDEEEVAYADVAEWLNETLNSEDAEAGKAFWRRQLTEEHPKAAFTQDHDLPFRLSQTKEHIIENPNPCKAQAEEAESTPATVALTAWSVLWMRITQLKTVPMVTILDGRSEDLDEVVGPLARPLPLLFKVIENALFKRTLLTIRDLLEDAEDWQECFPLDGSLTHYPAFQWQEIPEARDAGSLLWTPLYASSQPTPSEIKLVITEQSDGLHIRIEYDVRCYHPEGMNILRDQFVHLFQNVLNDPRQQLSSYDLISTSEKQRLLVKLNESAHPAPPPKTINQRIEEQALRHPNNEAVILDEMHLDYVSLDHTANGLAHKLRKKGLRLEEPVALCMGRSPQTIVALLAVIKAGGISVGLQIADPIDRLHMLLEDCGARFMLTNQLEDSKSGIEARCFDGVPVERIDLQHIKETAETPPLPMHQSDNLAYIIYTSGSTGKPKGVMVTHQSLVNLSQGLLKQVYDDSGPYRISLNAPLSFDASMQQVAMLMHGFTLCIVPEPYRLDAQAFIAYLSRAKMDAFDCTPNHLSVLVDGGLLDVFNVGKRVLVGGGAVNQTMWNKLARAGLKAFNVYGPTECTVDTTAAEIKQANEVPTLGRPLPNNRVYVVDGQLDPLPHGITGQLAIAGLCLARGYLNRPKLTAQAFVPNPFALESGERLYLSGDLARFREYDRLEFRGRMDFQVKIRGYRIELEEIEAILQACTGIKEATVLAQTQQTGQSSLVAYYTAPQPLEVDTLRLQLQQKLPDYMIPTTFIYMDALPLKPSGKVDRGALPEPSLQTSSREKAAPRNEDEASMLNIWQDLLKHEAIGIHDNFFEIGGDSIIGLMLVGRARSQGIQISLPLLFQEQTIAGLVQKAESVPVIKAEQGATEGRALLTPIQRALLEQRRYPNQFNQSMVFQLPAGFDDQVIEQVFVHLTRQHDVFRLRFDTDELHASYQPLDSGPFFILSFEDLRAMDDTLATQHRTQLFEQAQSTLHLTEGPLMRVVHLREKDRDLLAVFVHHMVIDGVSWRIILEDFLQLADQIQAGRPPQLPPKTTSWQQWANQIQELAQSSRIEEQLDYWLGLEPTFEPTIMLDHAGNENLVCHQQVVESLLDETETNALLREIPSVYNTNIDDILLTALVLALGRSDEAYQLHFSLEGHGRHDLFPQCDVSRTVGWFTTAYPVLLTLPKGIGPGNAIKCVKEQLRAIPDQGLGYGLLRYLNPETSPQLMAQPLPQLSFNYLGQLDQTLSEDALLQPSGVPSGPNFHEQDHRQYILDINGAVVQGCLRFQWLYSDNLQNRNTVEQLAASFTKELQSLLAHCTSPEAGGHTPSDFPLITLQQESIDQLNDLAIEDIYPATPMQQGLMLYGMRDPAAQTFKAQMSCSMNDILDGEHFRAAWQRVVNRHAILRTLFRYVDGEPVQIVLQHCEAQWQVLDWRDKEYTTDEAKQQVHQFSQQELTREYNMDLQPVSRVHLIRVGNGRQFFVWTYHHVIMDGWSAGIILSEVMQEYNGLMEPGERSLPTYPFRNYVSWLQKQDPREANRFWKTYLSGFEEPNQILALPGQKTGEPTKHQTILSPKESAQVQSFVRKNGLTLATLLQGTWGILLGRYSAQRDVVFGVTVAGRPTALEGFDKMVGIFINSLPLRLSLDTSESLIPWFAKLQQTFVEISRFDYSPLVQIQKLSEIDQGNYLFESLFVLENYPMDEAMKDDWARFDIDDIQFFEQTNYPLALIAYPEKDLRFELRYNGERLDDPTAHQLMSHYHRLLLNIVEADVGQAGLDHIPMLSPAQSMQLLQQFNQTSSPHDPTQDVLSVFQQNARKNLDQRIITFHDQHFTFRDLDHGSNQIAAHLKHLGIAAEDVVGVAIPRSPQLILAFLGIIKAGAAYLPLDLSLPEKRLNYMIRDSRATHLLTQDDSVSLDPLHTININQLPHAPYTPECTSDPNALIYIMYTSGSTGEPKGVRIEHRGVVRLAHHFQHLQPHKDRMLFLAATTFDASTFEIWGSLLNSIPMVIFPEDRSLTEIGPFISEFQITTTFITTALFHQLAAEYLEDLQSLKTLLTGGEVISPPAVTETTQRLPELRLYNCYGPTENTTFTTMSDRTGKNETEAVPIGSPITDSPVYVLDQAFMPVPIGVVGQLYCGGTGLARDYLNHPTLTAQCFVPHPYGTEPGARLYATKDLVRWLPNGQLEFHGRTDHQVKLRGFRIELDEVTVEVMRSDKVKRALTILDGEGQNRRLITYVEPKVGTIDCDDLYLRAFLTENLPAYMIPSVFIILEYIPLKSSGKIDRAALPKPSRRTETATPGRLPQTPTELKLAALWQDILDITEVQVQDHFFDLGGHSLTAVRLSAKVRDTFKIDFPLEILFDQPVLETLAAHIDTLQKTEQELTITPLKREERTTPVRLSWAQERLWFIERMNPGNVYNMPFTLKLEGNLNVDILHRAFQLLVNRHESLRTRFGTETPPTQWIDQEQDVVFIYTDLSQETNAPALADEQVAKEAGKPFDLENGPVFRVHLFQTDSEAYSLLVCMHHIVSDGWSIRIILSELSTLYRALLQKQTIDLVPLQVQYADFAVWQRQWFQGDIWDKQLSFWSNVLQDAQPTLDLPTDHPRPPIQTFRGANYQRQLGEGHASRFTAFSQEQGITPFMTGLAAFAILLSRYTNQGDITIGTPIANRNHPMTEGIVGFFVNTLALRVRLNEQTSFATLLQTVRQETLEAFKHQDLPFEKLVDALQTDRDMSRSPLFQVLYSHDTLDLGKVDVQLPGVTLLPQAESSGIAKFDLSLNTAVTKNGLAVIVNYNTDLFEHATAAQIARHYTHLLDALLNAPNVPIFSCNVLSEAERSQLLKTNQDRRTEFPAAPVHELFHTMARQMPDQVAVQLEAETFTYGQLSQQAHQLAAYLRHHGVNSETLVAVCLKPSFALIVSLLGILEAGGAYLPLDPDYPEDRLRAIFEDAQTKLLISQKDLHIPVPSHVTTLQLDDQAYLAYEPLPSPTLPSELAYVMYTSGSTGVPKGVAVTHPNIVRLVRATDYASFSQDEVFLFAASVAFDAATFEIWGSLLNGARLAILPTNAISELPAWLAYYRVTSLWLTAQIFHWMVDHHLEDMGGLNQLLAGGEALSVPHVEAFIKAHPQARLINGYGPTEGTTFSTTCNLSKHGISPFSAPIGQALNNASTYATDTHLRLVAPGVEGELMIGGIGLARGYWNRPAQTAERFIPDPFSTEPGARLYHSGDRVRIPRNGLIEYVGRLDRQVKVRGFRIEPGEIEFQLRQVAGVGDAFVRVLKVSGGDVLVGYVQPELEANPNETQIKNSLSERLPTYMVPATIIIVPRFPRTANGKLDHRQLPDPHLDHQADQSAQLPQTPTEVLLAQIWCEVMDIERVHQSDNFFELGGHSLMAVRVVSRIRDIFQVNLSLKLLFSNATLEGMAREIENQQRQHTTQIKIEPLPRQKGVYSYQGPLSWAQERLFFIDRLAPGNSAYNIPVTFRLKGPLNPEALHKTTQLLTDRHESLRTRFAMNGTPQQIVDAHQDVLFTFTDQSKQTDAEASAQAKINMLANQGFDLEQGPLFRADLFRIDREEHLLLLCMHHIISDGWSMRILLADLIALYDGLTQNGAPTQPNQLQYADYAHWQRSWLRDEALENQLTFWRDQLENAPTILDLPRDKPRPTRQTFAGANLTQALDSTTARAFQQGCLDAGVTPFMGGLAVLAILLNRYSGASDLVVGTVVANRNHSQTENIVGFFVNTLALRFQLDEQSSFAAFLQNTRTIILDAYAHEALPFEKLIDHLGMPRDLSRTPLFQVSYTHDTLGLENLDAEMSHLQIEPVTTDYVVAKFDLTVSTTLNKDTLNISFNYNTDLFAQASMQQMLGHYSHLLKHAFQTPETRVGRLSIMDEHARRALLYDHNQTDSPFDLHETVHQRFEAMAHHLPDHIAARFESERVTFQELDQQANGLAHHLRGQGLRPEELVVLYKERDIPWLVAMLGVLKAGGAYLPMDVSTPLERVSSICEDADARFIMTDLNRQVPEIKHLHTMHIDPSCRAEQPPPSGPGQLFNVIYTSGSTGLPKGVLVTHRGFLRMVTPKNYLIFSAEDTILQLASPAFDASTLDVWNGMLQGATLAILPSGQTAKIPEYLQKYQANAISLVPSILNWLVDHHFHIFESMRCVFSGGEAMSANHARKLLNAYPQLILFNAYGPTEGTVAATAAELTKDDIGEDGCSIGGPIANTKTYAVDQDLQPVPYKVAGELMVGGHAITRGYLKRPALTAERFIPDPFSQDLGSRLYRTGDLVRFRSNGSYRFAGRMDRQLKLRGFRIELPEIEHHLRQIEGISDAYTFAHKSPSGKRLISYVQADPNTVQEDMVRKQLSATLPHYMVPAVIMVLPTFPLTKSKKVDRKHLEGLPLPDEHQATRRQPQTQTEHQLAALWCELLGVDEVGIDENFFQLGGHSLLAITFVSRLREEMHLDLPLQDLFRYPILEELASHLDTAVIRAQDIQPILGLPRNEGTLAYEGPLSWAQERLWFIDRMDPGGTAYHLPALLQLNGALQRDALRAACQWLVDRHESLRTVFQLVDGVAHQQVKAQAEISFSYWDIRQENWDASTLDQRLARDAAQPFHLGEGPLFRVSLYQRNDEEWILLLCMHHIVSDGWSMRILFSELMQAYTDLTQERQPNFSALPLQYVDFAVWQKQFLTGNAFQRQLDFWQANLHKAPYTLDLPIDKPRPELATYAGANHVFTLDPATSDELTFLCQQEGVTPFMAGISLFAQLLARYTQQQDLLIGTPVANRHHQGTRDMIGFFVNTLALRFNLQGDPSFRTLLQNTKQHVLDAFEHQDMPFEKLVDNLKVKRQLDRTPLFQVLYSHDTLDLNQLDSNPSGLQVRPKASKTTVAKFELSLNTAQTPDGLQVIFNYNTDLFEASTIEHMGQHFTHLVKALVTDLDTRLGAVPLLGIDTFHKNRQDHTQKVIGEPKEATTLASAPNKKPTATETQLCAIWARLFDQSVNITDDFFELGGHSLLAVRLTSEIRKTLNTPISLAQLFRKPVLQDLALEIDLVQARLANPTQEIAVPLNEQTKGKPLFMVHPGGGQVHWYMELATLLPYPVIGLQHPGLADPSKVALSLEALVQNYLEHVRAVVGPVSLMAWSMGGPIAYAMASTLEAEGVDVDLLLCDSVRYPSIDEPTLLRTFAGELGQILQLDRPTELAMINLLADGVPAQVLLDQLAANPTVAETYDVTQFHQQWQVFRNICTHALGFRANQPFQGPLTFVRALKTQAALPQEISADYGWGDLLEQSESIDLPTDHYQILRGQQAKTLVRLLQEQRQH